MVKIKLIKWRKTESPFYFFGGKWSLLYWRVILSTEKEKKKKSFDKKMFSPTDAKSLNLSLYMINWNVVSISP